VVPLGSDDKTDEAARREPREELCTKHADQRISLRCTRCAQNICIQCKLTRHEGHDTEDLEDAGARVKDKLSVLLEDVTLRKQRLKQLVAALGERRSQLQQQRQEIKSQLQQRADTLTKWVFESLDEAMHNFKAATDQLEASLLQQEQLATNKMAALQAQRHHLATALMDGSDKALLELETKLASAHVDDSSTLAAIERELRAEQTYLKFANELAAVTREQVIAFIGKMQTECEDCPTCGNQSSTSLSARGLEASLSFQGLKQCRELVYSRNADTMVMAICPISNSRLWVSSVKPADNAITKLKLFDAHGQLEQFVYDSTVRGNDLIPVLGDVVLAIKYGFSNNKTVDILHATGQIQKSVQFNFDCSQFHAGAACGYPFGKQCGAFNYHSICIQSMSPFKCTTEMILENTPIWVQDISRGSTAFVGTAASTVEVYTINRRNSFTKFCSYKPKYPPCAARFCLIEGQEMLLVLVPKDNAVHIVDYAKGRRVAGNLDTGSVELNQPSRLFTDYDKHVWIGCNGGKVLVVDL
jgi:hypothetical protein